LFAFLQDVYNFLLDTGMDPVSTGSVTGSTSSLQAIKYSSARLGTQDSGSNTIDGIMNGVVKQKLKIIPKNHTYVSHFISSYILIHPRVRVGR
jgi:serine carboxypeptidase 1